MTCASASRRTPGERPGRAWRCMRAHGITNLPDPTVNGHGIGLQRGGIDLNSPQFRAAQQACHMPGS